MNARVCVRKHGVCVCTCVQVRECVHHMYGSLCVNVCLFTPQPSERVQNAIPSPPKPTEQTECCPRWPLPTPARGPSGPRDSTDLFRESCSEERGAAYGAQALGPLPPSGHLTQRSCFQDEHGSRLTEALGSLLIQPQPPEPPVAPEPFVFEGGNGRMFPPTHLLCGRPGLHIWAAAGGGAALPGPLSPNDKKTESCQRKAPQPLGPLGAIKDAPQFP